MPRFDNTIITTFDWVLGQYSAAPYSHPLSLLCSRADLQPRQVLAIAQPPLLQNANPSIITAVNPARYARRFASTV